MTRNARGDGAKTVLGRAVVRLAAIPGTGRQVQKSVYGKTRQEVAQKLRQVTHEIDQGIYLEPAKMTVGAWLDT